MSGVFVDMSNLLTISNHNNIGMFMHTHQRLHKVYDCASICWEDITTH